MCDVLQELAVQVIKLEEEVRAIKMVNDIKGGRSGLSGYDIPTKH
jgi:hypothetical protein